MGPLFNVHDARTMINIHVPEETRRDGDVLGVSDWEEVERD